MAHLVCDILDQQGNIESASIVKTTAEAVAWYRDHGVDFALVQSCDDFAGNPGFTFKRS